MDTSPTAGNYMSTRREPPRHSMTYALLPDGDAQPRFLCCGLAIMQAPQAVWHLRSVHGLMEDTWAIVAALQAHEEV